MRLMKLMYLAERESIRRSGLPMVFDDVYAMREGMALSRTFALMTAKQDTPTTGEWARHIAPPSHLGIDVCQGIGDSSLDGLTWRNVEVVGFVWGKHGGRTRDELVHEVHHHLDEWLELWGDPNRGSAAVFAPYDKLVPMVHGPFGGDAEETSTRAEVAAELFREQALSLSRAARFAGTPVAEFMVSASKRGIPVIAGDAESVREEVGAIDAWREGL